MIIKINSRLEMPIYLQLRNQIVKGIGKGELEQGEILPTVRTGERAALSVYQRKNIPRSRLLLRKNWRMSWSF